MKMFAVLPLIFLSYASAANPDPQNLTCGEVKHQYKKDGCCGAPSKKSNMTMGEPPRLSARCQCIGSLINAASNYNRFTRATMLEAFAGKNISVQYHEYMLDKGFPKDYSLECDAHDQDQAYCQEGGEYAGAKWCDQPVCFTSAKDCPGAQPTVFFKDTKLDGLLYYSYEHCGGTDYFTGSGDTRSPR